MLKIEIPPFLIAPQDFRRMKLLKTQVTREWKKSSRSAGL